LFEELYLADTGSISDGVEKHWLVATLNGDTVFLGKQGVRAIVPERNLPTAPRKSVRRSSVIDRVLEENYAHVENSSMIVFEGRLYVYLNGTIYVADETYTYQEGSEMEYEWWILKSNEFTEGQVKDFRDFNVKGFL
jgi:hypothetical protein